MDKILIGRSSVVENVTPSDGGESKSQGPQSGDINYCNWRCFLSCRESVQLTSGSFRVFRLFVVLCCAMCLTTVNVVLPDKLAL